MNRQFCDRCRVLLYCDAPESPVGEHGCAVHLINTAGETSQWLTLCSNCSGLLNTILQAFKSGTTHYTIEVK